MAVFKHLDVRMSQSIECPFGGFDVGLANVEVVDLRAALLGSVSKGNELADSRLRQFQTFFRYVGHCYC